MKKYTQQPLLAAEQSGSSASPARPLSARRSSIRVYRGAVRKLVYVEIDGLGNRKYWDEESGDVRCFPFTPSEEDKTAIDNAIARAYTCGAPGYVDLDISENCLVHADSMTLGEFRRFALATYGEVFAVGLDRRIAEFLSSHQQGSTSAGPGAGERAEYSRDGGRRAA